VDELRLPRRIPAGIRATSALAMDDFVRALHLPRCIPAWNMTVSMLTMSESMNNQPSKDWYIVLP
jgi:hypothetical protein